MNKELERCETYDELTGNAGIEKVELWLLMYRAYMINRIIYIETRTKTRGKWKWVKKI